MPLDGQLEFLAFEKLTDNISKLIMHIVLKEYCAFLFQSALLAYLYEAIEIVKAGLVYSPIHR
jgi:hypothetical protein